MERMIAPPGARARKLPALLLSLSFLLAPISVYGYHLALSIAVISVALLAAAVALVLSKKDGLLASIALPIKALMALDLVFAIANDRPLRYLVEAPEYVNQMHVTALYALAVWILAFTTTFLLIPTGSGHWNTRYRVTGTGNKVHTFLFVMGQAAFAVIVVSVGGLLRMLESMSDRYELYFGIGFLRVIVAFGGIYACHLYLRGRRKTSLLVGLVVFAELAVLGGRSYALFSSFVPLIMVWIAASRRLPILKLFSLAPLILAFVVALGAFRSGGQEDSYSKANGIVEHVAQDTGAADNFPSLLALLDRGVVDFNGSQVVASSLVAPIPRIIWPNKPVTDAAAYVGTILAGASEVNWGLPIGPHGLAYFTGGMLMVPFFALASALIAIAAFALARRHPTWMPFAPFILLLAPDALSPAIFARLFVFFLVGIVLHWVGRQKSNENIRSQ